ncbi:hypothetical protein D9M70_408040 [compost metagenome]
MHGHLAEGAHDHQDGEAADDVGEHDGRAGHLDRLGRAEEQADADAGAQGHQADMPLTEVSVQRFMLWLMISNGHAVVPHLVVVESQARCRKSGSW